MSKKKAALVEETRSQRIIRDKVFLEGYCPGSPEALAFAKGYATAAEIVWDQAFAAQPSTTGPLVGTEEDKARANEYSLSMGKTEDARWASYRDYLRGLQDGRVPVYRVATDAEVEAALSVVMDKHSEAFRALADSGD